MKDMSFTALVAMGMHPSHGAVIEVTASDDDVRKVVTDDITSNGDKEFIDVLGDQVPATGMVRIVAELEGWPDEYEAPSYKLTSSKNILFTSVDTSIARRFSKSFSSPVAVGCELDRYIDKT